MPTERKSVVLAVDDFPDNLATISEPIEKAGYEVVAATSRVGALAILESNFVDLLLLDQRIGRELGTDLLTECRKLHQGLTGIIFTGYADLECALQVLRAGATDLLVKPVSAETLTTTIRRAMNDSKLVREARYHRWRAEHDFEFSAIVGESIAMQKVKQQIRQVAASTVPVLIRGESGSGKELVARAIHEASPRKRGPWIALNAGAVPAGLMESTLFGAKKGSYTGSYDKQLGLFEAAKGGTLFLDEIGETTGDIQVRLLRVLQEKIVTRVGEVDPIPVDARIVAATNRDLAAEVEAKRFREDLYYRLAVFPITLPPLRDRLSDIEELARNSLERHSREQARPIRDFADGCFHRLRQYHWPGNVRELDNVIQRAVILAEGSHIKPDDLVVENRITGGQGMAALLDQQFRAAQANFEKLYFTRLLARSGNNKSRAAELAGLDRSVFYAHLRRSAGVGEE